MSEKTRLKFVGFLFFFLIAGVLVRTFHFQVVSREPWSSMAPRQYQGRVKLMAHRGIIYDRHMNIMAMDLPIYSLAVDPSIIKDKQKAAFFLSKSLGLNEQECIDKMSSDGSKSFVYIKKDISEQEQIKLKNSGMQGLVFVRERKRVRPFGDLAIQTIGIVNNNRQGVGGVEQALNDWLEGRDGWAILQKDARNKKFTSIDYPAEQSKDGHHVVLTIDHAFQSIIEEEMKASVEKYNAKSGTAVLMDPLTGDILAISSVVGKYGNDKPKFNQFIRNRAIQDCFEPGSIFKVMTASAALQTGQFKVNTLIHCENGEYTLAGHKIHDHNESYAWLTLSQVLEKSSNIGIAKVGQKLGRKTLFRYIRDFGFGNRTGVDLPGEEPGILHPAYDWNEFEVATTSFGQGIAGTALQIADAVSAVANGGRLLKPLIWKKILDSSGKEVRTSETKVVRRVISEETAFKMRRILESVVKNGSGRAAGVEGVRVAGKTGTAQKSLPGMKGYVQGAYVSSFVGFWPADTPFFVLVIVFDEPKGSYWGSHTAAPVFSAIVSRLQGIAGPGRIPRLPQEKNKGRKRIDFASYTKELPLKADKISQKSRKAVSIHYLPDLTGFTVRDALEMLIDYKIKVKIEGCGVVLRQIPGPGNKVKKGMICRLICNTTL
ncbi:transpeptidase family protein [bacterium]|nr:transpeptidase family protein [bacterium]